MFRKRLVFRKWGWYLTLFDRKHFKVKLLRFNGKTPLSKQYHLYRDELWLFMKTGEFKYIPRLEMHTYNPKKPEYVLEIQYGHKCEEADIVRL